MNAPPGVPRRASGTSGRCAAKGGQPRPGSGALGQGIDPTGRAAWIAAPPWDGAIPGKRVWHATTPPPPEAVKWGSTVCRVGPGSNRLSPAARVAPNVSGSIAS